MASRFFGPGLPFDGFAKRSVKRGLYQWTGRVALVPEHLADPLRWKKPRRIFLSSMSDIFHEGFTNEEIAAVFGVMAAAPRHTFQVLTKRAKRMREWFEWMERYIGGYKWSVLLESVRKLTPQRPALERMIVGGLDAQSGALRWPLPNVWLGVSVEDQERADERIPELLRTPATVRFLSVEPQLGPIDLDPPTCPTCEGHDVVWSEGTPFCEEHGDEMAYWHWLNEDGISWVIQGGESGSGARPFDLAWARSLRDQCEEAGVAYFLKQLGACAVDEANGIAGKSLKVSPDGLALVSQRLRDPAGGDMAEWPSDLRVREFPEVRR